jgi:beta-galactosidase GanA
MRLIPIKNSCRACACLALVSAWIVGSASAAPPGERPLPRLVEKDGRYAFLVDGAPYLILGAQVNNSSAWPAMLPKVWPAMEALHVNTVEIPVYWEQFEPRQGQFDTTLVDTLLQQAREHHVRLVLLWFGTWKNGSGHYQPECM